MLGLDKPLAGGKQKFQRIFIKLVGYGHNDELLAVDTSIMDNPGGVASLWTRDISKDDWETAVKFHEEHGIDMMTYAVKHDQQQKQTKQ